MDAVRQLSALQDIDTEIDSRRKRLAKIAGELKPTGELLTVTRELETREGSLHGLEGEQKSVEWDVENTRERIATQESRLYGNQTGNPRELESIESEIAHLKERQREMEDRVLDLMTRVEEATAAADVQRALKERLEAEWTSTQGHLLDEKRHVEAELPGWQAKRVKAAAEVPAAAKKVYENLRVVKGGVAVARVVRNMCGGCGIGLPTAVISSVKEGKSFIHCNNCERLLVA